MTFGFYFLCLLVFGCYVFTTVSYWQVFSREEEQYISRARIFLWISLGLHGLLLLLLAWLNRRYPFATAGEALLFCSWLVGGAHLASEFFSRSKPLGIFTLLPTTLGVFISIFLVQPVSELPARYHGAFFSFHIVTSLTAYACFAVATILAAMYILLFRKLKSKDFDVFYRRLPPLENLEQLSAVWVLLGSAFMIISPLLGRIWVMRQSAGESGMSARELGIFLVMFLFLGILAGRKFFRLRGIRFTVCVIIGFVLLLMTHLLNVHGF
jgi:ABC-type uncharacterized transport system permease subunit